MQGRGEVQLTGGAIGVDPRTEPARGAHEVADPRVGRQVEDAGVDDRADDLDDQEPTGRRGHVDRGAAEHIVRCQRHQGRGPVQEDRSGAARAGRHDERADPQEDRGRGARHRASRDGAPSATFRRFGRIGRRRFVLQHAPWRRPGVHGSTSPAG
jgi:hypothetical protein